RSLQRVRAARLGQPRGDRDDDPERKVREAECETAPPRHCRGPVLRQNLLAKAGGGRALRTPARGGRREGLLQRQGGERSCSSIGKRACRSPGASRERASSILNPFDPPGSRPGRCRETLPAWAAVYDLAGQARGPRTNPPLSSVALSPQRGLSGDRAR